jgi:SAP domain-containing new25/Domain of unknown function (DUF6434)
MQRPALSKSLSVAEFESWYWLKSELQAFCRFQGIGTGGSKEDLVARIVAHLSFQPPPTYKTRRVAADQMPVEFELDSVIGSGWRCTQALRRFFQSHVGTSFRFNEALRTFIGSGSGRTLNEALEHYKQSIAYGPRPIAKQFEYNNHMREYRRLNPGSSHAEAVSAWWAKRGKADV